MIIELGGGTDCPPQHTNLDPVHGKGPWRIQAQEAIWPTDSNTVDHINASHVLEHIPAGDDRIFVMNEAWRVLKPGGTITITVPLAPSDDAFADPTHVSYWVPKSFDYFTQPIAQADYGIRLWHKDSWRQSGNIGTCTLRKPDDNT